MINPMESLPGYGAIIKNHFELDTEKDRTLGDLYAAVLDYLVREAWTNIGLFPAEEEKHRAGISVLEVQEFLDWAMAHLIEDMEMDAVELDDEVAKAIEEFMSMEGSQ